MKLKNDFNLTGVLFDLDGVLLDTEGTYTEFWSAVERRYPTGIDNFAHRIKGSNLATILDTYFPGADLQREVTEMLDRFQAGMEYRFFPGALELLDDLAAEGIPACLVTSSDRLKMEAVYGQHPDFRRRFADVVTGDMVTLPKPDPQCFRLGAERLGIDIGRCVVIEDSLNGLRAGRASGARVIGLTTTCTAAEVEPLCDRSLPTIAAVTPAIIRLTVDCLSRNFL